MYLMMTLDNSELYEQVKCIDTIITVCSENKMLFCNVLSNNSDGKIYHKTAILKKVEAFHENCS